MRATIAILATLVTAVAAFAQDPGPFTRREAQQLAAVWPEIREAGAFEDINWEAVGLTRAPGNSQARTLMATRWDSLRRAPEFSDIDWQAVTAYPANPFEQRDQASRSGPFTRQEAQQLAAVWPEIRNAASFEDIDWQAVGLRGAPGDAEARRLMSANWGSLRHADQFSDIDWQATVAYRAR